ncbi:CYCT1-5 [Linum grandiflorum]
MLELYEQNKVPQAQGGEVEAGSGQAHSGTSKASAGNLEHATKKTSTRPAQSNDNGSAEGDSVIEDHNANMENKDVQPTDADDLSPKESVREAPNKSSRSGAERTNGKEERTVEGEARDDDLPRKSSSSVVGRNLEVKEAAPVSQSPKDAIKMIDRDKVKAALEKRKKARVEMTRKKDVMDEDDLIERELEDGIELAAEDEKLKRERRQNWSKMENTGRSKENENEEGGPSRGGLEVDNAEEGEMLEDGLLVMNSRKRKAESPAERLSEGKKRYDQMPIKDDHRRHSQENHS